MAPLRERMPYELDVRYATTFDHAHQPHPGALVEDWIAVVARRVVLAVARVMFVIEFIPACRQGWP